MVAAERFNSLLGCDRSDKPTDDEIERSWLGQGRAQK